MQLRKDVSDEFKWNLKDIYQNKDEFYKEYDEVNESFPEILSFKGKLKKVKNIKSCLDKKMEIIQKLNKLSIYTSLYYDQDQSNEEADSMDQKVADLYNDFFSKITFIEDEILKNPEKIKNNKTLSKYKFYLEKLFRQKEHFLTEVEESLLSKYSDVFGAPNEVYTVLKNQELKFPNIKLNSGEEIEFNESVFRKLKSCDVREDRKTAFDTFFKVYDDHKNTFTKLIFKEIRSCSIDTEVRNYESSLQRALYGNNIPEGVYNGLIRNINKNLPKLHNYLDYRKELMGYDKLYYYDLHNSIIPSVNNNFSYDEAKKLISDSTSILGERYTKVINKAFDDKWIDLYPNKYKESGAYMQGCLYHIHPYILMNYLGKYDDVSTLTHELGHAVHSYFSNKSQNFVDSRYSTFIAEIASTTNEILLFNKMVDTTEDNNLKRFLLSSFIDSFRTTVFRQTMFSEFEQFMHETVESGEMLTSSMLNSKYLELLKTYHGNSVEIDELYANEWQFVPHFYYNFYVYQYATSYISSVILSQKILKGDKEQLDKYLELLKAGGSDFPVNLLNKCGVDLTDEKSYDVAFEAYDEALEKLKNID